ncbi:MAG TPA: PEFG-CTERM sorting domain-containing protein [Nitrosopumilaceae archaeon]|nr:PEFG-CTERM sorting domain-containing protein [Nitrosopumilaceae archaeon]
MSSVKSDAQAYSSIFTQNTIVSDNGSPILIYRDSYSPTSVIHVVINAPDFNSNPYAIDTIGDDPENKIIISTRESSIPYRLVETGMDTGVFAGYVTLSGTTSTCSPVCGPTDGLLTASGDDGLTVSFTYAKDRTIIATLTGSTQDKINNQSTPEFGSLASFVITISIIGVVVFSRRYKTISKPC